MRRGGGPAALLTVAALVLAVWVTSSTAFHLLPSGSPTSAPDRPPITQHEVRGKAHHLPGYRPLKNHGTPLFLAASGYVLLGLVAAVLLAFLVTAAVRRQRRARAVRARASAPEDPGAVAALGIPPAIAEAARRQLVALREGSPRNAIVACWMELERACRESGLPREPTETSTEFTRRVLSRYAVGAETVGSLASLYREARFSNHRLSEAQRERAVADLGRVLADVDRPRLDGAVAAV